MAWKERYTNHEQSSSSPTVPAGLAVTVWIMQIEVVVDLTPYEVSHSIEILNASCSIAVTGCLLQIAECSLMLLPQHHLMRPQPAGRWPKMQILMPSVSVIPAHWITGAPCLLM